jgi:hypothetical protein
MSARPVALLAAQRTNSILNPKSLHLALDDHSPNGDTKQPVPLFPLKK